MLPQKNRLNIRREFARIKEKGEKIFLGDIVAYSTNNNSTNNNLNSTQPKLGITISKKVAKKATLRNRIRRKLSAELEKNVNQLNKNSETIIIVLRDISHKTQKEIQIIVKKLIDCINNYGK